MEEKEKKKDSLHLKLIPYFDKYGILLLLVLMIVVMQILQPDVFLSWRNVTNVFKQISWQSMLALGVFMVIVTAGIDLSVGSIIVLPLGGNILLPFFTIAPIDTSLGNFILFMLPLIYQSISLLPL